MQERLLGRDDGVEPQGVGVRVETFRSAMATGRSESGDIPAEIQAPAAGLGAGRPERCAISAAGRSIRGGKRVRSAGCGNTTDPTAGSRPETQIITIAAYLICAPACGI